ncbi:deoxyribodipyrimidine photo-lyase [Sesbania bispinosa]|nr:deoxyribodipyrimidine photo-lyase [Sesbania bispinosa]
MTTEASSQIKRQQSNPNFNQGSVIGGDEDLFGDWNVVSKSRPNRLRFTDEPKPPEPASMEKEVEQLLTGIDTGMNGNESKDELDKTEVQLADDTSIMIEAT